MATITNQHASFRLIPELNELCAPLFNSSSVHAFAYARLYPNGTAIMLDTHFRWHQFLFQENGLDENQLISYES